MKLGISSYSLNKRLRTEEMSLFDVIDWAKEHDCAHLELVPFSLPLLKEDGTVDYDYVKRVRDHAEKVGMPLSAFSLNACVIKPTADERKRELDRIRMYMDMAHFLGIKKMRHDTCSGQHPNGINTPEQFEKDFPVFVDAVRELADYAATLGMSTTLENHGLYVNGADRMVRLLNAVDRPNVGMTLDVGNFLCVDDRPEVAVAKCIKYADMIHLKDFYIRKTERLTGVGGLFRCDAGSWFSTNSGLSMLRGSILAQGDLDVWETLRLIRDVGYDGYVSVEFEGMEEGRAGSEYGMDAARFILESLR